MLLPKVDGIILRTIDPQLTEKMLPEYPNLPATTESYKVNEIRRTLVFDNIDSSVSLHTCITILDKIILVF